VNLIPLLPRWIVSWGTLGFRPVDNLILSPFVSKVAPVYWPKSCGGRWCAWDENIKRRYIYRSPICRLSAAAATVVSRRCIRLMTCSRCHSFVPWSASQSSWAPHVCVSPKVHNDLTCILSTNSDISIKLLRDVIAEHFFTLTIFSLPPTFERWYNRFGANG
jgi:hypothetical protein